MSIETPGQPVYPDIEEWGDLKLCMTYARLSRDLRQRGFDRELGLRMCAVERVLRDRGFDPDLIAHRVEAEQADGCDAEEGFD